ncbi:MULTISPECIES: transaldolase [unclassified Paludibacterium]|uniref:transaldolase n=1 Tax=unclassified Paludibacterium TaxID=2618429 RepID=UPI001C0563AB|nr:transaldolase [Paludibacterium sp. B53371]BEV72889.1 transaldolase [Paludibacterium sp. THUN1379]
MNRLQAIRPFGQRIWLDNLSRELLFSGELARLIKQDGIAGVTSNPTIFHKAISTDPRYRDDLVALKARGMGAEKTYEELVIPDVRTACDMMLPVYQQSERDDGYVSLEVSPLLANDVEGTLQSARDLWQSVGRPNLMIKIPATPAGIEAFGVLIREGINVNITLLFSLKQVEAVWDAYIAGLSARHGDGHALAHVKAVASFFLSRVDSLLDPQLPPALQGKGAIALSKAAYARYTERFHGAEFAELARAGGRPQYLLWASTGTKNPAYSDVLYVESLIGAETINTVPDATLDKFRDHGEAAATLRQEPEAAREVLAGIMAAGIDLDAVGEKLQQDGLKMFVDSFNALMELTA